MLGHCSRCKDPGGRSRSSRRVEGHGRRWASRAGPSARGDRARGAGGVARKRMRRPVAGERGEMTPRAPPVAVSRPARSCSSAPARPCCDQRMDLAGEAKRSGSMSPRHSARPPGAVGCRRDFGAGFEQKGGFGCRPSQVLGFRRFQQKLSAGCVGAGFRAGVDQESTASRSAVLRIAPAHRQARGKSVRACRRSAPGRQPRSPSLPALRAPEASRAEVGSVHPPFPRIKTDRRACPRGRADGPDSGHPRRMSPADARSVAINPPGLEACSYRKMARTRGFPPCL